MKNKWINCTFLSVLFLSVSSIIKAQPNTAWSTSTNIGIGTTSPAVGTKLHIAGGDTRWINSLLRNEHGGAIELGGTDNIAGTGTPYIDFHYTGLTQDYNMRLINTGNKELSLHGGSFLVSLPSSSSPVAGVSINAASFNNMTNAANSYYLRLRDVGAGNKDVFQIKGTGQVLINTTCVPAANVMLAVNGQINATAIQVKLTDGSGCFPDYVFEKEYKLLSLGEVEKYIKANKHLPDVPSAKEVEADGMDLAKMNNILLRKVEELTLHMIEMKKEIEVLKKK